jgi:hypothetical protein
MGMGRWETHRRGTADGAAGGPVGSVAGLSVTASRGARFEVCGALWAMGAPWTIVRSRQTLLIYSS